MPGDLRKRAEAIARERGAQDPLNLEGLSPKQAGKILHELRVNQIELEVQNAELSWAQAELATSRAKYFDLYDLAPVGYFSLNEKGFILEANLTSADLLKTSRNALVKQPLSRFILPEDKKIYLQHRQQLVEEGMAKACEVRMLKKDAEPFWAQIDAIFTQTAGGEPVYHVVLSDITGRKEQEQHLRRLATVVRDSNDAITIQDFEGRITAWNLGAEQMFGYSEEEALQMTIWQLAPPQKAVEQKDFNSRIFSGELVSSFETQRLTKDGRILDVWLTVTRLTDDGGKVIGIASTERDITERKKEEEEKEKLQKDLLQSEKMAAVGKMAAGIAHEINNPMTVISGFAQSLAKKIKPGDASEMAIKAIERESVRCNLLIETLLTFSRISPEDHSLTDVNSMVEKTIPMLVSQSRMVQVNIKKDLADGLPKILANSNQIQQVVVNLANNAFDAMSGGGTLTLTTELLREGSQTWVCIKISDTGSGIPPEMLSKIFEPFFTTKGEGKGTGLGLSLVYDMVKKNSGTITVESRPGCTEFTVKFESGS